MVLETAALRAIGVSPLGILQSGFVWNVGGWWDHLKNSPKLYPCCLMAGRFKIAITASSQAGISQSDFDGLRRSTVADVICGVATTTLHS